MLAVSVGEAQQREIGRQRDQCRHGHRPGALGELEHRIERDDEVP